MKTVSGLLEDVILAMDEAGTKVTPHDPLSYAHTNRTTFISDPSYERCCFVLMSFCRHGWLSRVSRVGNRTGVAEDQTEGKRAGVEWSSSRASVLQERGFSNRE